MITVSTLGLFLLLAGFVIDLHGFLARRSSYWTEATIRTHKVTKPLIWGGLTLALIGGSLFYHDHGFSTVTITHLISLLVLILNGSFLSFVVSPFLLARERAAEGTVPLPALWQRRITVSFLISAILWWGNLFLLAHTLSF
jgi:hypothetical protein